MFTQKLKDRFFESGSFQKHFELEHRKRRARTLLELTDKSEQIQIQAVSKKYQDVQKAWEFQKRRRMIVFRASVRIQQWAKQVLERIRKRAVKTIIEFLQTFNTCQAIRAISIASRIIKSFLIAVC